MSTRQDETIARIREALGEDPRTHSLDVEVRFEAGAIVLSGWVSTRDRHEALSNVARQAAPPGATIFNRTSVGPFPAMHRGAPTGALRIAAVGDVHVGRDAPGLLRRGLSCVAEQADLLLLAGDLTQHGSPEEGRVLAGELRDLGLPIVAVLGNHDYHADAQDDICASLERVGVTVLEGRSVTLDLRGRRIGIAGVKGFGGGFAGACCSEFGEPEMKAFVQHAKVHAGRLQEALRQIDADVRIALTHYSPVPDTLRGEPVPIYPFLGSYLLAEAIDAVGCDLALHGHAHRGSEVGVTAEGVPVRNVARPVIREAYRVFEVGDGARMLPVPPISGPRPQLS